jgi:hypothetical protein
MVFIAITQEYVLARGFSARKFKIVVDDNFEIRAAKGL